MTHEVVDLSNLPDFVWEVIGKKLKNYVALNVILEVKSEKYEQRLLVAAEMRLYVLKQKPLKLETNLHYGDITLIKCSDFKKLTVGLEGKQLRLSAGDADSLEDMLKQVFDYFSIIHNKSIFDKRSPSLELSLEAKDLLMNSMLCQERHPHLTSPCGNLSTVYKARCDQMGVVFYEDVAWDIDAIYNSKDCRHFELSDFDHLSPKQLVPLLASFESNSWFTKIIFANIKMTPETGSQLLRVLRENTTLQVIDLSNTTIKTDYVMKMMQMLSSNSQSSVHSFDLSNNPIDDKGISHLIGYLSRSSSSDLVSLNLSGLPLTHKTISSLADCLQSSDTIRQNLTYLNLSNIAMKGEENNSLQNFLAQPNSLITLKLANTEYPLENLFAAALRGCSQHLERLDLSGCTFSRKTSKDTTQPSWKHFFGSVASLKHVDFSSTRLPSSALLCVLEGLESNSVVTKVSLNLSGCQLSQSQNINKVLNQSLSSISKINHLDISDNGFDHLLICIFNKLAANKHITHLSIGRNFNNVKPKIAATIMEAMVAMLQHENNAIDRLEVDGMRMKQETTLLVNSLVTNNKLTHLDISGNHMGDIGMKMLSKALLLNRRLETVVIDNNQLSVVALNYLATALEKNTTLQWIPTPLNDMLVLSKVAFDKLDRTWKKIETHLQRNKQQHHNNNQHRQNYALEQWISNSFDQELMNSRLHELSLLLVQADALKLKRRTIEDTDQLDETHFAKMTACKKAFYEARHLKKLFLEADDFCNKKSPDDMKFIHELSTTVQKYIEWLTEQYDENIKKDFETTLAVNSLDELYKPFLTREESGGVCSQMETLLQTKVSALKHHFIFDRTLKYNDLLLNSALFSTEKAIFNAKSICNWLSKKMIEEGLMGPQDVEYVKLKKLIDVVEEEPEGKRRSRGQEGVVDKEKKEDEDQPQRINSNKARRPVSNYAPNSEFSLLNVDIEGCISPTSPQPAPTTTSATASTTTTTTPSSPTTTTKAATAIIDLDALDPAGSSPRLTHLAKDRPKRIKNKVPTRPVQRSEGAEDKTMPAKAAKTNGKTNETDKTNGRDTHFVRDRLKSSIENLSTPMNIYSKISSEKMNDEDVKIPLPVIRMKNKPPDLPPNRPKYTPKGVNATHSTPVTAAKIDHAAPSVSSSDSPLSHTSVSHTAPTHTAPTPMRRHMVPGGKGLLIPTMDEIKAKRNTMRHVPSELGSQPCLSKPQDKVKRLTDFSGLNDDNEASDRTQRASKPLPPLPPKPTKHSRTNSNEFRNNDTSEA